VAVSSDETFPRQLTVADFGIPRQLTAEGILVFYMCVAAL